MSQERERASYLREHPWIVALFVVSAGCCALLAVVLPIAPELPIARRALGGAIAGAWFAMFPIVHKLFD